MNMWNLVPASIGGRPLILSLGGFYLLVAAVTALVPTSHDGSVIALLVVFAFIGGSGLVFLVGGYRLPRTDLDQRFYPVVSMRCLAGVGVMLLILGLYHVQPDTGLSEPERSVPILTGFAGVAGYAVGMSDARAKTREAALEQQTRELERIRAELEESNERLEQFAYVASHDLQEPLRMVSSYLQLVDQRYGDELDEDGEEFLAFAVDGAERMREMIDGLLAYSRVETQGDPFEPIDMNAVLEDVRQDLAVCIEESDATIEDGDLPQVEGDPRQLRQLFQNLLSNAIEYSGDESPHVEIDAERDGETWTVAVRDDGIGIEPDAQDRVFDVFQRLHGQEEHPGTGIGLALCERIAERHGGDICLDSEPGEGSTFSVALPALEAKSDDRTDGGELVGERPSR